MKRALTWIAQRCPEPVRRHLEVPQTRDALFLMLNTGAMAVSGLLFWLVLTRLIALPEEGVGQGYAIVSLGTAVAVVAKGGFDTALMRHAPGAARPEAAGLLRLSLGLAIAVAVLLTLGLPLAAEATGVVPALSPTGWFLVFGIGALLSTTWLQDAYFIADREARYTFLRNSAASAVRILLPLLIVAAALPQPVALAWAMALVVSVGLGVVLSGRMPDTRGEQVSRRAFLHSAVRNVASNASEFLPGLLLAPMVLAIDGPRAAAFFGIAWTVAQMIFQVSASISRSALVAFADDPGGRHPEAVRRGILHHLVVVLPGAALAALLAPWLLGVFGPAYAANGTVPFIILAASILLVAPAYLYLALLRARERVLPLVGLPTLSIALLFTLVPVLNAYLGLAGVSLGWLLANAPLGVWGTWRLYHEAKEVTEDEPEPIDHRSHAG